MYGIIISKSAIAELKWLEAALLHGEEDAEVFITKRMTINRIEEKLMNKVIRLMGTEHKNKHDIEEIRVITDALYALKQPISNE